MPNLFAFSLASSLKICSSILPPSIGSWSLSSESEPSESSLLSSLTPSVYTYNLACISMTLLWSSKFYVFSATRWLTRTKAWSSGTLRTNFCLEISWSMCFNYSSDRPPKVSRISSPPSTGSFFSISAWSRRLSIWEVRPSRTLDKASWLAEQHPFGSFKRKISSERQYNVYYVSLFSTIINNN